MKIVKPSFKILTIINGFDVLKRIEQIGRVCYKSEDRITDTSAEKFVKAIMDRGHECYDEETELLTKEGFKFIKNITKKDECATLNIDNNYIEYQKPINLYNSYYSGKMYSIDTKGGVNLLVTPNHRIYGNLMTTVDGRKKNKFEIKTAEEWGNNNYCFSKDGIWLGEDSNIPIDVFKLLGFAIGDGYFKVGNQLSFHLKLNRKIKYLYNICNNLNFNIRKNANNKFAVDLPLEYKNIFRSIYNCNGKKTIPTKILNFNRDIIENLLDGLINSDGSISKKDGQIQYSSTSKDLIDKIQQLCLHINKCVNINLPDKNGCYSVNIHDNIKPEINRLKNKDSKWVYFNGNIYCVQVPNGIIFIRRKGKGIWCGNSVIEHENISIKFIFDRGISHEAVRHRIAAHSQESTRFCCYSQDKFGNELTFIEPIFWTNKETDNKDLLKYNIWLDAMFYLEQKYLLLIELGAKPEEARSILPNSLKTELVVTTNLREWRHILKLRTSGKAHPQMREIMIPLLNELHLKIPVIFDDIYEDLQYLKNMEK